MDKRVKILILMCTSNKLHRANELAVALNLKYVQSVYNHLRRLLKEDLLVRGANGQYGLNTQNKKVMIVKFLVDLFGNDAELLFTRHTRVILEKFSAKPTLKTSDLPHHNLQTIKKLAQKTKLISAINEGHRTTYFIRTWEDPTRKLLEYFDISLKFDEEVYRQAVMKHFSATTSRQARFKNENDLKLSELNMRSYLEGGDFILDKLSNAELSELVVLDILTNKKKLHQQNPFEIIRKTGDWKIKYVYNTDRIEGNPLTMEEVRTILTVGMALSMQKKDVFETINSRTALDNIFDTSNEFTAEFIKKLHLATQKNIAADAGEYKTEDNCIVDPSGTLVDTVTPPQFVEERMHSLIDWYNKNSSLNPIVRASVVHNQFVYVHPFSDGNGRVARLLFNFILIKHGYYPIIFYNDLKYRYYSALRSSKNGDMKPFLLLMSEFYREQLDAF